MNLVDIKDILESSFPFKTPRKEQEMAFDALSQWISRLYVQGFRPLFFGLDAPTGIGKSAIALAVARGMLKILRAHNEEFASEEDGSPPRVWIVTLNKILQDQYRKDFDDYLFDFRGQDNYKCYEDIGKSCAQSACARIKAPRGEDPTFPQYCTRSCEYDEVKSLALEAPILLLNVAKAINLIKTGVRPDFMIFDEGHGVESALDSEAGISIDQTTISKLKLNFNDYFNDLENFDKIKKGLEKIKDKCLSLFEEEELKDASYRDIKLYREAERLHKKCEQILSDVEGGIQYVSCSKDKLDLKPLQINKIFERTFNFPVLFLSATLLSKRGFSSMTGINESMLDWFSCDSPFPMENRPIYNFWRMGAPSINFSNESQEIENLINRVSEVLSLHPQEKGIIHTHTYRYATEIYQRLYVKFGSRLIFPKNSREQKEALDQHEKSKNTVLLSPSMTEGVDLRDDLCRFVILCKVPYLPMGDPVVIARKEQNPDWYAYRSAMTIVQAPGRGVRSEKDFAKTYLLDPGFMRFFSQNKHLFPEWFLSSIVRGYKGSF